MPGLTPTQLNDLVAMTQKNLGKPDFTEIATDLQDHTAMREIVKKSQVRFAGGQSFEWRVMVNHAQSATNASITDQDDVDIVDTMEVASADWRYSTVNYAFLAQEVDMNREPNRIIDLVREKRVAAMIALAELMETNFWGPPVALTDTVTPWGINTWVVKNATEGFNGGAPSGHTTIGLNPSEYSRWKNYTAQYTNVSFDDLVRKWRQAATKAKFKPPVDNIPSTTTGYKMAWYSNYACIGTLEELLQSQNENIGTDLATYDGAVMFRRLPVKWVPKLDADTTNPVYGIQWGDFKMYVLKGWWLKETNIPNWPFQHNMNATFMDSMYQWVATNRRSQVVMATGTTYPS